MRVLVCGSRAWPRPGAIKNRIDALPEGTVVIEGAARGADRVAGVCARARGLFVAEVECANEHWELFGRSAGHRRNAAMLALQPDLVIAFQLNGSSGTQGTIDNARRLGIPVEVHSE